MRWDGTDGKGARHDGWEWGARREGKTSYLPPTHWLGKTFHTHSKGVSFVSVSMLRQN